MNRRSLVVTNPKGDDHPYSTVNDLMNITDIAEIQLDHLRNDYNDLWAGRSNLRPLERNEQRDF